MNAQLQASANKVLPDDEHNQKLIAHVYPATWNNPIPQKRYHLVVLGGGTAGLVTAAGAAGLGGRVALVERRLLGGDCLNYGCVPSKAFIRAARAANDARTAADLGVRVAGAIEVDFPEVARRMRKLRADLSGNDSATRFKQLGVDVFLGDAKFVSPDEVEVAGSRLRFARAVIATGGRPTVPEVPGLVEAGFLTNESIFSLPALPRRLLVLGGGPIGCELAQAFRRFGSEVWIVSRGPQLLPKEDKDAAAILQRQLEREGIHVLLEAVLSHCQREGNSRRLVLKAAGKEEKVEVDEVLVAAGRSPNVDGMGLEAAGVAWDARGVRVDDRLRTSNRRIFAAGDCCSRFQFTHAADAMARIAIQNALFGGRKSVSALAMPWCTYTEPEIAHVGMNDAEAKRLGDSVVTHTLGLQHVDRAVLDGETEGFGRVHVDARKGTLLGATLVARHAGEMIGELSLAMTSGLKLSAIGATIHPYPTQSEVWKKLADAHNRARLSPRVKRIFSAYFKYFFRR
jgi:pyruvate/2-oxoglutarate dehydrogenase complex dihydrolipoamide dehydrogenase (E3) component